MMQGVSLLMIEGAVVRIPRAGRERPAAVASQTPSEPERRAWMSVSAAAKVLGFGVVSLRRMIERNARRSKDGTIEAYVDGVRARKIGRTWRVQIGAAWSSTPPTRGVVHEHGGSVRRGGNE